MYYTCNIVCGTDGGLCGFSFLAGVDRHANFFCSCLLFGLVVFVTSHLGTGPAVEFEAGSAWGRIQGMLMGCDRDAACSSKECEER